MGPFPPLVFNTSGLYARFSEAVGYAWAARMNPGLTTRPGSYLDRGQACLLGGRWRGRAYFGEPLIRSGALYFSVTVFSTVGFGEVTAKADPARLIVTAQEKRNDGK